MEDLRDNSPLQIGCVWVDAVLLEARTVIVAHIQLILVKGLCLLLSNDENSNLMLICGGKIGKFYFTLLVRVLLLIQSNIKIK